MIVVESKICKKYALAFLRVYKEECIPNYMETLITFSSFIERNRLFQATLDIPSLPFVTKSLIIEHVAKKLHLSYGTKKLIFLLLKSKRIDLICGVIKSILFLHREQEKKYHFVVTCSHELSVEDKSSVEKFIAKQVGNHTTANFAVDKSLISGIRIEGNQFLWERSISKQLRTIKQNLLGE